jgi:hypothetical protein
VLLCRSSGGSLTATATVGESPGLKKGYATRAVVSVLRGWWVCFDAKLARAERTGRYLLCLASSSGLMKLN